MHQWILHECSHRRRRRRASPERAAGGLCEAAPRVLTSGRFSPLAFTAAIDRPKEGGTGKVGLVPDVLKELAPDPSESHALGYSPPTMIRFAIPFIREIDFGKDDIVVSLENRMKCER